MIAVAEHLSKTIEKAKPQLLSMTERRASEKPYPDKWSLKEILGHLIDSAANNHHRIVRMQEVSNIGAFTYAQTHWVASQDYQSEPWSEVVEFWYRYNMHLAHIIRRVQAGSLGHACEMGSSQPATLRFVIEDYVRHLHHHLDQIFSDADPMNRRRWVQHSPSGNS